MARYAVLALLVMAAAGLPGTAAHPAAAGQVTPRGTAAPRRAAPSGESASHRATLDRYCVTCHNQKAKTAGLALDAMSLSEVPAQAEVWETVVRRLRTATMPSPHLWPGGSKASSIARRRCRAPAGRSCAG